MFTDVKFALQPNAPATTLNIKPYHIINLQFRMQGFLLTMQNSSYDAISFQQNHTLIVIPLN